MFNLVPLGATKHLIVCPTVGIDSFTDSWLSMNNGAANPLNLDMALQMSIPALILDS